ncbi:polysaccharide biosynthesis protein [Candidatus Auribacterota bacterium]
MGKLFVLLQRYRYSMLFISYLSVVIMSYFLSFFLRFDFIISNYYFILIFRTLPVLLTIKLIVYYKLGMFHFSLRHVSLYDAWSIIKANSVATVLFIFFMVFSHGMIGYPRSVFVVDWGISCIMVSAMCFVVRFSSEKRYSQKKRRDVNAVIVGAGQAGIMVLKECKNNPKMSFNVVGFVDDNPSKRRLKVHGLKILGTTDDIPEIVNKYMVDEIIIAIPSARGEIVREIISSCQSVDDVAIKIVPGVHKILKGDVQLKVREVQPEDLLGRESARINKKDIKNYVFGKCVLVTGAAGSIGSELSKQIAGYRPSQLVLLDYNENDIYFLERELKAKYQEINFNIVIGDVRDVSVLKHLMSKVRPNIIFHAAAFKHVPLMEENPAAAVKNNIIASRNLMYAANHYGVESFVLISTDKAVNPRSIMGASKSIAEMILQAKNSISRTKYVAVRFGNVLGSKGSVVPLFKKQIEERMPVTVTHPDAKRYFMSIKEAVQLVLQAASVGNGGEVFILDMGEQIKVIDLAKNLITLSGLKPGEDIPIRYTGLRKGEKIYEELLLDSEKDKATKYDKLFVTQPYHIDPVKLRRQIRELEILAKLVKNDKIIEKISEIVPSFSQAAEKVHLN